MSYTPFKEISINNPGTAILYGGNDTKEIMELLNGKVVTGRRPSILNTWIWLDHFDIKAPGTAPVQPTDSNTNRIYTDPTDFKLKVRKTSGTIVDVENTSIPDSSLAAITNKAKLPSTIMYEDENNNAGDHYMDFGDMAAPANPPSGTRRLFFNSATGELSVRTSAGTTLSLESIPGTTTLNDLTDVVISSPASAHALVNNGTNWVNRLLVKADLPNVTMFTDVNNNLGDHYMDVGDITTPANPSAGTRRLFLNSATGELSVRTSAGTTVSLESAGGATNLDGLSDVILTTPSNTQVLTYNGTNWVNATPSSGGDVFLGATNTYGDFDSIFRSSRIKLRNPANTQSYSFVASAIAAARNITLPLLTGDDTMVTAAFAQTMTNKTINTTDNSITATSQATGDILANNGTKFIRKARGTALQVLRTNSGATDIEWASLDSERVGKSTASGNGSSTLFNITHGLGSTPTYTFISVQQSGSAFIGCQYTVNSTTIAVTFASAPASGTNNVIIHWRVVA